MNTLKELKTFIILWLTQALSSLGSSMTSFALVIWLYKDSGSALTTALLTVCSYAPYVIVSIFAGAISDKWNKKAVMLICDSFAALSTVGVLVLLKAGALEVWHLYIINALNGLMNSVQSPASDVATTLLTPKQHYQKTSAMRYFSNSLVSIMTPVLASAIVTLAGLEAVIAFDLATFVIAFTVLLLFIKIPEVPKNDTVKETLLRSAKNGVSYLIGNKGILCMILFLSAINFIASIANAALPALILSKSNEASLGAVSSCTGIAALVGSVIAAILPKPKSRSEAFCISLFISMSTENFLLAFGNSTIVWCIGGLLGWITIPLMSANYDVIFRSTVPTEMLGRVYSVRNTLQFFSIPVGYFLGGILIDKVFEPFMANTDNALLLNVFGTAKGSGAAFLFFVIGVAGVLVCIFFSNIKALRELG